MKIAEVLRQIRCRYIFTHYEYDDHPDHVAVCKIVEAARFYAKLTKSEIRGEPFYPEKILYFFPNHISLNIHPSFLVDISEFLSRKKDVLSCYESQFFRKGKGEHIDNIILANKHLGFRIHKQAAEPFYSRDAIDITELAELFLER